MGSQAFARIRARGHVWQVALGCAGILAAAVAFLGHAAGVAFHHVELDFSTRYAAAEAARHGADPYTESVLHPLENRQAGGIVPYYPAYDPPPTIALFRILTLLPLREAQRLWFLLLIIATLVLAATVVHFLGYRFAGLTTRLRFRAGLSNEGRAAAGGLAIVFVVSPVQNALAIDQLDPAYVLPLLAAVWSLQRASHASPALVAALCVLALLKPQTTALPALVCAGQAARIAPRRAIVGAVSAAAVLAVLSQLVVPSASWANWLHGLRSQGDGTGSGLRVAFALVGVAGALLAARAVRASWDWRYLLVVACAAETLLSGFVRWNSQWSLLLVFPLAALAFHARATRLPGRDAALLAITAGLLLGDALANAWPGYGPWGTGDAARGLVAVAAVAALVAGCALLGEIRWRWAILAVVTNAAVVVPPLTPNGDRLVGLVAAGLMLWQLPRTLARGSNTILLTERTTIRGRTGQVAVPDAA